jgi:pimeloyl-ACP methyl ester carboxylesterase
MGAVLDPESLPIRLDRCDAGLVASAANGTFRAGTGQPLVLLHIGARPWLKWENCLPALTERFDVFVPTYPGCEGGEPLAGPATIDMLVDGIERAMDAAGIDKAHCVGNSIGGWIAFDLARRGRARSAIAFSPGGGWNSAWRRRLVRWFFAVSGAMKRVSGPLLPLALSIPFVRRLLLRGSMEHGERLTHDQAIAIATDTMRGDFRNVIAVTRDVVKPYPELGVPMLIAWGERDKLTRLSSDGAVWREAAPNIEFRVLSGLGHMVMFDDPELTVATILEVTARTR